MKKISLILMIIVLILVCCSCGKKSTFVEGNLLYDLGAKSLDDIEKVEFMYEEYESYYSDRLEITENEDIQMLCRYIYSMDYPTDKLHEIYVFPSNSFYVTIGDVEYQLFLGEDGNLTTVPNNDLNKARTYKVENGKGFTYDVCEHLIEKYK